MGLHGADKVGDIAAKYTLKKPSRITLNAAALNTMLGLNANGTSFKLTFEQTANPNVFANELTAVKDTLVDYVIVANKSTGKYLRVDSAYNNTTGVKRSSCFMYYQERFVKYFEEGGV